MIRSRTALVALALAAVALGGCSRQKPATESSTANDVADRLVEDGYLASADAEPVDVDAADADAIGSCVGLEIFSSGNFTEEERKAATSVLDGDDPDPDLVLKVEDVVNDCYDQVVNGAGDDEDQTTDDDAEGDANEETTTTEG